MEAIDARSWIDMPKDLYDWETYLRNRINRIETELVNKNKKD